MGYRLLTDAEIVTMARQLQQHAHWQAYRDYALKLYGNVAHTITATTGAEYNDEGGYDTNVEHVSVCDSAGNELDFDFGLPFWQEKIASRRAYLSQPKVQEEYKKHGWALDWDESDADDAASSERYELPVNEDNETEFTFLVHEPPFRPNVFVLE